MKVIYNIGILLFSAIARLLSPFNSRASLWVSGRKKWAEKIADNIKPGDRVIWMHCASLGEFEQGRPVIEAIKKKLRNLKLYLLFFLLQVMRSGRIITMPILSVIFHPTHRPMQANL